jgi:LysM repeat protein
MKTILLALIFLAAVLPVFSEDTAVLEEKINKLSAQVEDLQYRQQKTDKTLEIIQVDLKELRRNTGSASTDDLKAIEARIAAVDAARQKDKQVIVDELAKQLAALGTGIKPPKHTNITPTGEEKEHIVQRGEYLSVIARKYGVTVAELRKNNNLASDELKIGQKLTIPSK